MMNSIETQNRLRTALGPSATFRWTGSPQQGLMLRAADTLVIPFSLLWGGFAIFWESTVIAENAPVFMQIWGIPFVLVGLFFIAGRFFADAYARAHTAYAIGDGAAYIVRDGLFAKTTMLGAPALAQVEVQRRPDGSGTLTFGQQVYGFYTFRMPGVPMRPAFEGIAHVDDVFALLQDVASGSAAG